MREEINTTNAVCGEVFEHSRPMLSPGGTELGEGEKGAGVTEEGVGVTEKDGVEVTEEEGVEVTKEGASTSPGEGEEVDQEKPTEIAREKSEGTVNAGDGGSQGIYQKKRGMKLHMKGVESRHVQQIQLLKIQRPTRFSRVERIRPNRNL